MMRAARRDCMQITVEDAIACALRAVAACDAIGLPRPSNRRV